MTTILIAWGASALALLLLAAFLGSRVRLPDAPRDTWVLGILIDNRGRFSLNRLQLIVWSIVVISLVSGVFFGRLFDGVDKPLGFTIPDRVLGLMGISLGAAVTAGAVKATKKAKAVEEERKLPLKDGRAATTLATYDVTNMLPFFWQMFMQEEGDYADDVVDVTKFQGFGITIVLVVAYIAMAITAITHAKTAGAVTALPDISGTFLVLLGISYGGYISGKLPTPSGAPRTFAAPTRRRTPPGRKRVMPPAPKPDTTPAQVVGNAASDRSAEGGGSVETEPGAR